MKFRTKLILSYILIVIVVIFFALFFVNMYLGKQFSEIIIKGGMGEGYLIFVTPKGRSFLHAMKNALIWSGIITILMGTLLALFLSKIVSSPLKEMENFAKRISEGDYTARINVNQEDELGHLEKTLNKMAESLREIENMRKSLVQNVSHDLRTPLTSLKGYIEMVTDPEFTKEEKQKAIKVIKLEIERMESMLEELSRLSAIDSKHYELKHEKINLTKAVKDAVELMEINAKSKNLKVNFVYNGDVFIVGDKERIKEIAINLMSNAIKFTEKGEITISVKKEKGYAIFSVKDTGRGIKEEDIPKIFDRFFREERSRSKVNSAEKGGLGVGLTIVKELVEAMDGTISVKSKVGKGSEFIVKFPLAK